LHGCALAYYLTVKAGHTDVTVVEKHSVAAAASGKGGGFLARDWGSGPTVQLHEVKFCVLASRQPNPASKLFVAAAAKAAKAANSSLVCSMQ
jgi:glycine/D-amino acid oxidase-like deaminating enzyme